MTNGFNLDNDDVVSLSDSEISLTEGSTATTGEILEAVREYLDRQISTDTANIWTGEGPEGRVLQVKGGGWKTGKIRLRIEFIPDKPEE